MQLVCVRIKLKPDSLGYVRRWADTINARRDEARRTLVAEGVVVESFFLERRQDGDWLIAIMRAPNIAAATAAAPQEDAIQAVHQQFQQLAWERVEPLELLVDVAADASLEAACR